MKLYGSLNNRIMENIKDTEIKVGTGCTEFRYSDREAYEVVAVKDQKHVTIRRYDHELAGEPYSNNWKLISNESNPTYDVVRRGNYWYIANTITSDELTKVETSNDADVRFQFELFMAMNGFDKDTIIKKGKQTKLHRFNIRFGNANYYYDYEL